MKTLQEIREEREKVAAEIKALQEQAEQMREQWKKKTIEEKAKYIKETPESARIMRKLDEIEKRKNDIVSISKILQHNYRVALALEVVPALAAILEKYAGKQAGEKTREKMRAEMLSACGCSFHFVRNFMSDKAECAEVVQVVDGCAIAEHIRINTTGRAAMIDENNTIKSAPAETLRPDTGAYIEDPAARLEEIKKAREELEQAKSAYNAAADKLNELLVVGFDYVVKLYK